MTSQPQSPSGLDVEEANAIVDVVNDSIVDRFSDITIIEKGDASGANSSKIFCRTVEATHIIVLIHGWMGNPAEMSYIRQSIQNAAAAQAKSASVHHRFVIHSVTCNCDKTDDGIALGGSRLAQEINELVGHVVERCCDSSSDAKCNEGRNLLQNITLSIVGNSLGGLYARHALAGINWNIGGSKSSAPPVMLIPMVFLTTATPHLGISQHTYVPLPRAAEFILAKGMKETGRDFFRFTPVLEDLFCKDYFLDPLSNFQQRIAYINVYGTDFQVPTATAAFWAPDSDSPHHRVKHPTEDGVRDAVSLSAQKSTAATLSAPKAIVMTLTTPRCPEKLKDFEDRSNEEKKVEEGEAKEEGTETKAAKGGDKTRKIDPVYTSWSKRLDRLGWTKVLVDIREDVPGVRQSIASAIDKSSSEASETNDEDNGNDGISKNSDRDSNSEKDNNDKNTLDDDKNTGSTEENPDVDAIPDWITKDTWTAGELLAEFKGGLLKASSAGLKRQGSLWDLKPRLPLGHTVMIANAKDEFNKKVTTGGKPVMDYLGASLVQTLQESVSSMNNTNEEMH